MHRQQGQSQGNCLHTSEIPIFLNNIEFWFETKRAFGASSYGGSEFGEVMATVDRITSGDYDGWYDEWNATAERVFAIRKLPSNNT